MPCLRTALTRGTAGRHKTQEIASIGSDSAGSKQGFVVYKFTRNSNLSVQRSLYTMDNLPLEIMVEIVVILDLESFLSLSRTNKYLYRLLSTDYVARAVKEESMVGASLSIVSPGLMSN